MKILFAASEAVPFSKTGGLADVAGSLPPALAADGHDVRMVVPLYQDTDPKRFGLRHVATYYVPLGVWRERCDVLEVRPAGNVTVYFIDKGIYFDRPGLYGTATADYADNAERFAFFSRAALELCGALDFKPDIVHSNDWQTGLVPLLLKTVYRNTTPFGRTKSIFTVHNLGYQGLFPPEAMRYLGVGWDHYTSEGIEFWGKIGFLKAGLVYADAITTVSRTYAGEIQSAEHGAGLQGVLSSRSADLYGILNGIDSEKWDPGRDSSLAKQYDISLPAGKASCKKELLRTLGLPPGDAPVIGMVTRLVHQKGLDILADAMPELMALDLRLVVLGTGEETYHRMLTKAEADHPGRLRVQLRYDERLARIIYAGSDLFLMPSRYEPCGLGQMIALRYGAIPVVRRTGGLADTVADYNPKTRRGTGFVFQDYSAPALIECLKRALSLYSDKAKWRLLMLGGMKQDFSWEHSAEEYIRVYRKVLRKK